MKRNPLSARKRVFFALFSHFFADFAEAADNRVDVFAGMRGTDLRADPGFPLRDDRIGEGDDVDAFVHHPSGHFPGGLFIIKHNRYDRMHARDDIETGVRHFLTVISGDVFKMIAQRGIGFQNLEDFQRSGDDGRRQGVGEQIRAAALTKQIDNFLTRRRKAAGSPA